ncbi:hypothetical protein PENTCL1PPCAC_19985, partial [Pristionchus entomophagus]
PSHSSPHSSHQMARGAVGWRFSRFSFTFSSRVSQDCAVANDRLLFYTIKPDCSIPVATGAIPSAQFK